MSKVSARCPSCGEIILVNAERETGFCGKCGTRINTRDSIRLLNDAEEKSSQKQVMHQGKTERCYGNECEEIRQNKKSIETKPEKSKTSVAYSAEDLICAIENKAFHGIQRSDEYHEFFHPCKDFTSSETRQYRYIVDIYTQARKNRELFLFYYDNTLIRNGKESFLLTEKGIHFSSERYQSGFIPYSDIRDIRVVQKKLFPNIVINDEVLLPTRFLTDGVQEFCDDMLRTVIPFLLNVCA